MGLCCVGRSKAEGDQQEEDWSWREPDGWCAEMAVVSGFVGGRGIPPVSTGVGISDGGVWNGKRDGLDPVPFFPLGSLHARLAAGVGL